MAYRLYSRFDQTSVSGRQVTSWLCVARGLSRGCVAFAQFSGFASTETLYFLWPRAIYLRFLSFRWCALRWCLGGREVDRDFESFKAGCRDPASHTLQRSQIDIPISDSAGPAWVLLCVVRIVFFASFSSTNERQILSEKACYSTVRI